MQGSRNASAQSLDPAQSCQLALQVLATLVHSPDVASSHWLAAKLPTFVKVRRQQANVCVQTLYEQGC